MATRTTNKTTTASKGTTTRKATMATTASTADFEAMLGKHTPTTAASVPDGNVTLPKCAAGRIQRGRPHPSLLFIIARKGNHPGKAHRIKRWSKYEVGMSLLHCRITEGLDHLDIGYYTRHKGTDGQPLMTLRPMTDAERKEAVARWEGDAVDAQPSVGSKAEGGTMNASDAAQ